MISTGMVPNYDLTRSMSESEIETFYQSFLTKPSDIMEPGVKDPNFKQTGSYEGRPIYPNTQVRYLRTMDNRMKEVTLSGAIHPVLLQSISESLMRLVPLLTMC